MKRRLPIAIFDSGLGGLTVFRQLTALLPNERVVYFADTKSFPLGNRSSEQIQQALLNAAVFLQAVPVKLILFACHTASSYLSDDFQEKIAVPLIGMKEGTLRALKKLPARTKLALLATEATIRKGSLEREIQEHFSQLQLRALSCPSFASAIEQGQSIDFTSIQDLDVDAALLGCTHFPMIQEGIQKHLKCRVIDPAIEVCQIVRESLERKELLNDQLEPLHQLYTTSSPESFETRARQMFVGKYPFTSLAHAAHG